MVVAALLDVAALFTATFRLHARLRWAQVVKEGALLGTAMSFGVARFVLLRGIWLPTFLALVVLAEREAATVAILGDDVLLRRVQCEFIWAFEEAAGFSTAIFAADARCVFFAFQRRPSVSAFVVFAADLVAAKLVIRGHILGIGLVGSKACTAGP